MTAEGSLIVFHDGRGRWTAPDDPNFPAGGGGSDAEVFYAKWDGPSNPLPNGTFIEFGTYEGTGPYPITGPFITLIPSAAVAVDPDGHTIRFVEAGTYLVRMAVQSGSSCTQYRATSYQANAGGNFTGWLGGDPDPVSLAGTPGIDGDWIFDFIWTVAADAWFTVGIMFVGTADALLDGLELDIVKISKTGPQGAIGPQGAQGPAGDGSTLWLADFMANVTVTQSADLLASFGRLNYRVDLIDGQATHRVFNLLASIHLADDGVATNDILLDFTAFIAALFPTWIVPDFDNVCIAGFLTHNDAGPYILKRVSNGHLAPLTLAGVNLGATTTLANNDALQLNIVGVILDSD